MSPRPVSSDDLGLPGWPVLPHDVAPPPVPDHRACWARPGHAGAPRYACTVTAGHASPHVACGDARVVAVWDDEFYADAAGRLLRRTPLDVRPTT